MSQVTRSPLWRYAVAIATVVVAVGLTLGFWESALSRNPFALFYAAVMFSAWFGGLGPGLLATILAVFSVDYFFLPAFDSIWVGWGQLIQAGTFSAVAVLISSLNATRKRALETAEDANRAKDQFLAVLSHELRTPLTPALVLAASLEQDHSLARSLRADIGVIRRNIELEARLIDDLLDLTRIARGKLQLHPQALDVHVLIRNVMEICRSEIIAKELTVRVELNSVHPNISADSARLHQVLWNLVKNAIKFTPEGGEIAIRSGDADDRVRVEVTDTGIGIEPRILPQIFDAFEQGDTSITRQFGGLGLGLAISKALIVAHKGTLVATSAGRDKGATFSLELPTTMESPAVGAGGAALPAKSPPRPLAVPLRLLLVEDHADTARIMSRLLRSFEYEVQTADSVQSALRCAQKSKFDLVISDLGLPDGSGLELMHQLREMYQMKGIALSGYGMEEDVRKSIEAGFIAHLTKPINVQFLQATIRDLV
ncbi:MAG TPA: ATP-binding protein [Tepidisphaeraceae bacterium]|jgi:signal transduction histidine kinase